jgi:serpin B
MRAALFRLFGLLGLLFDDEGGTEAAAATAVIAKAPGPRPPQPIEFRADRPFLFLIRDARHDTILFLGRFTGP